VSAVSAAGGIIAAPYDSYTDQFPWTMHFTDHDALFDEIIACAAQKTTVSPARIHALGFSAGALMTTHLSFARSKSLASVAAYSGGQQGTAQFQEMNNKFPAMVITGGTGDFAFIDFYVPSQTWQTTLKSAGHFAMFCDHGGGHRIPASTVVGGVFQFFMDHPYGTNPSPYAGGKIPSAISICKE
jgi:predicted esterase